MKSRNYGTVELVEGLWHITADPHILLRIKRTFERVSKHQHGTLTLAATPENSRDLEWFCQRYPMKISASRELEKLASQHREHIATMEDIIDGNYKPREFSIAVPPRTYQSVAAEVLLAQGFLLLADDLGLGKSCSSILPLTNIDTLPAVIVCYPHLQQQWSNELVKFLPDLHAHIISTGKPYTLPIKECVLCKYRKRRLKFASIKGDKLAVQALKQFSLCGNNRCGSGPDVLIITYNKLSKWAEILASYCRYIVFDEIQELRRTESLKYTASMHIASAMQYRNGLTATPIYNYGNEMFNILEVLKPGCLGEIDEFHREWCVGDRVKDPKAFGSYLRENVLMLRRTRAEVGHELPPVIKIAHQIESDTEALKKIENSAGELARIILAQHPESFRGERMRAAEEFSNLLRQATGIAKAPYVAEFVNLLLDSGEQVLLAGWHRAVYDIWEAKLEKDGRRICWYTGSESPESKEKSKAAFLAGEADVMFISLRSGVGLDGLQNICKTVVIGEFDWTAAVMDQVIGRLHRDGQTESVTAYFLYSDEGSDPIMVEKVGVKRQQLEGIKNPDINFIEQLQSDGSGVRQLAEMYSRKRGLIT